jgi:cation:H+ antiporter
VAFIRRRYWDCLLFGAFAVASSLLLAWAAEVARVDISSALAIAILTVITVLPEYAVDLHFAYTTGSDPAYCRTRRRT